MRDQEARRRAGQVEAGLRPGVLSHDIPTSSGALGVAEGSANARNSSVTVYRLADDFTDFRLKDFGEADGDWLDFVCACRAGRAAWRSFDVIRGRVANDDVFKTIDAYLRGDMTRAAALRELRYARPNDQIALTTPAAIKALLAFTRSYVVRRPVK